MWMDLKDSVLDSMDREKCVKDDSLISNLSYWMKKGQKRQKVKFGFEQIDGEMILRDRSGCTEEVTESQSELELYM